MVFKAFQGEIVVSRDPTAISNDKKYGGYCSSNSNIDQYIFLLRSKKINWSLWSLFIPFHLSIPACCEIHSAVAHLPFVSLWKQNATSGLFKSLGDQLRQHPDRLVPNNPAVFKKLQIGNYAYPYVTKNKQTTECITFRWETKQPIIRAIC